MASHLYERKNAGERGRAVIFTPSCRRALKATGQENRVLIITEG